MDPGLYNEDAIRAKLLEGFDDKQASLLAEVVHTSYRNLVTVGDFNELKSIVTDLAHSQKRTEARLEQLAEAQARTEGKVEKLAEAQARTEARLEQLAEAQARTEARLEQLAEAQARTEEEIRKLTIGLRKLRQDVGGLSRSVSYGFENEAYRMAPSVLSEKYGINLNEKLVRAEIGGREVNLLGRGTRNGQEVLVVGEVKLRLDIRPSMKGMEVFEELDEKAEAVQREFKNMEIAKVLITHFATNTFLRKAEQHGVIVIQSYDW